MKVLRRQIASNRFAATFFRTFTGSKIRPFMEARTRAAETGRAEAPAITMVLRMARLHRAVRDQHELRRLRLDTRADQLGQGTLRPRSPTPVSLGRAREAVRRESGVRPP